MPDNKPIPPAITHLEKSLSKALHKRRHNHTIRHLTTFPSTSADFSSNDFLSLSTSPHLQQKFLQSLSLSPSSHQQQPSTSSSSTKHLGSGGSRLLDGNSPLAEQLEQLLANFHNAPAGLLCNSGYDANTGFFSCVPQAGDYIVYDEYIHASVHDGMRLSRAARMNVTTTTTAVTTSTTGMTTGTTTTTTAGGDGDGGGAGNLRFFAHNDMCALQRVLEQIVEEMKVTEGGRTRNVFIAVEAVYSMDGDICPLEKVVELKKEILGPMGNGVLIVDEAHSTGWIGPHGSGLVSALGLERECEVRLHTFGKALACNGAIVLCSPLIREYLINYARPLIYTTFMSYPNLAAIRASYEFLMEGKAEPLADNLQKLMGTLFERLRQMQADLQLSIEESHLLRCPLEKPKTPIFAVLSSEPKALAAYCQRKGFVVRGIVPPTVPLGTERIRVCLHAGNTVEQIEGLVACIRAWTVERVCDLKKAGQTRL